MTESSLGVGEATSLGCLVLEKMRHCGRLRGAVCARAMQPEPWVAVFSRGCIQQTWLSVLRVLEVAGGRVRSPVYVQDKGTSLGVKIGQHSWGDWPSSLWQPVLQEAVGPVLWRG